VRAVEEGDAQLFRFLEPSEQPVPPCGAQPTRTRTRRTNRLQHMIRTIFIVCLLLPLFSCGLLSRVRGGWTPNAGVYSGVVANGTSSSSSDGDFGGSLPADPVLVYPVEEGDGTPTIIPDSSEGAGGVEEGLDSGSSSRPVWEDSSSSTGWDSSSSGVTELPDSSSSSSSETPTEDPQDQPAATAAAAAPAAQARINPAVRAVRAQELSTAAVRPHHQAAQGHHPALLRPVVLEAVVAVAAALVPFNLVD